MPSRDPKLLDPLLQEFWVKLQQWYADKHKDCMVFLTHTYRSPEEQKAIYNRNKPGRVLTRCDGYVIKSKHNYTPSKAFDIAVKDKGIVKWEDTYYMNLGTAISELGYTGKVRWGGWFSFRDYCHFEVV